MINKYFALSLVAASVALASGCSSDDDDDNGEEIVVPAADTTNDSSAYDVVANSSDHSQLNDAIVAAGLADTLDDPANTYTILAPTNAAFDALDADALAALIADTDELTRTLQFHVLEGEITETDIANALNTGEESAVYTVTPLLGEGSLDISVGTETTYVVSDGITETGLASALTPMGEGATGVVYSIDAVLTPPEAEEGTDGGDDGTDGGDDGTDGGDDGTDTGTDTGGGDAGPVASSLSANNSAFLSAFTARFGDQKFDLATDVDPWTVFAPTEFADDADVGDYIVTGSALTVEDLLAAGSVTTFNGGTLTIDGTADALTVNGLPATLVGGDASVTYSVEGAL